MMNNLVPEFRLPQTYQIFVAGIPSSTSIETLRKFFENFGPVFGIEFMKIGKKRSAKNQPRKFCKLLTPSRAMFITLTQQEPPKFKGRALFCQPFMSGDSLLAHSADVNSRRVVVKKVLPAVGLPEIRETLLKLVGPIEVIYQYKSDFGAHHNSKDQRTFSVTFIHNFNSLQALVKQGYFDLPSGSRVEIEQFSYNRYRDNTNLQGSRNDPTSSKDISSSQSKTKTTGMGKGSSLHEKRPREPTGKCGCPKIQNSSLRVIKEAEFYGSTNLCHFLKPTAACYHRGEPFLEHRLSTCMQHPSTIRLNIVRPGLPCSRISPIPLAG